MAIWQWLDRELDESGWSSLLAHLSLCDRCQRLWQSSQNLYAALASLPRLKASPAQKNLIKARFAQIRSRSVLVRWVSSLTAVGAAVLLLAVLVSRLFVSPSQPETIVSFSRPERPPAMAAAPPPQPRARQPVVVPSQAPLRSVASVPLVSRQPMALSTAKPAVRRAHISKQPESSRQPVAGPVTGAKFGPVSVVEAPEATAGAQKAEEKEPKELGKPPVVEQEAPADPTLALPQEPPAPAPLVAQPSQDKENVEPGSGPTPPMVAQEAPQSEPAPLGAPEQKKKELVPLGIVTVTRDWSVNPPRITFTYAPSGHRLYERYGVALKVVPPQPAPPKVGEPLPVEPPIPWSGERYRSKTASVRLMQIGVSW